MKEHAICVLCGGSRDEPGHLPHCEVGRRNTANERPDYDEPGADPRDVPGTVSFRRALAKEKGYDE